MMGPYDSVFGNSPFDLDHDGHIDAGEASLIEDTVFSNHDDDDTDFDDFDDSDSGDDF
ncbi:hypothetical protein SAMN04487770_12350 [Butyrivibrio sp. ob235]|uniref:hypothetical protein n=1 Tax=Butyrivibrio sp. ob235 TaxID=1761780 RepID=UPI0008CB8E03|nr:hypothetical protein [Butyrivibrio sp. ob235]SEM01389.1 hypothetical protein SAMN04487770_12350 [Butyrivibrio sp. ob235]